jgi:hypothetical protein
MVAQLEAAQRRTELPLARSLARGLSLVTGSAPEAGGADDEDEPVDFDVHSFAAGPAVRRLPSGRLLRGQGWSIAGLCDELLSPTSVHADRRRLVRALATATHGEVRVDPDGWASEQTRRIASARARKR